ncbi:MAG: glycosyltransferase family 39 protein [Candidatus Eisenbacteria bacterium]|nr:glycosyltransferase family 39 protein [Candidatus Eisenbacteria bacterium]
MSLALIVAIGAALRIPLVALAADSYRLTESFNIEEVENIRLSTGMLHKHDPNPHAFEYPSLFYYLSLIVEAPLRAPSHDAWRAYLVGVRGLSLLFGLGIIWNVALLARRLAGDLAGLLAAALILFDRTMIDISTLAKPNAAQVFFVLAAFLAFLSLAHRPRVSTASFAAALLAFATASKWLGALALAPLALAPLLSSPSTAPRGLRRLLDTLRAGLRAPVAPWQVALPVATFVVLFLAMVPFSILSPREFGFGLAQTFTAQSVHQRAVSIWTPLAFAIQSLGPLGALFAGLGLLAALARLARWEATRAERGLLLVLGWALAYGALLILVFVKLPSYIDLWIPFLAILAGVALAGPRGRFGSPVLRASAVAAALIAGLLSNGGYAAARALTARVADTRISAGQWMDAHAAAGDSILADLGAFVPDRLTHVRWNGWGSPPRTVYDENATWGWDPVWPEWYGGHRRLSFENVKWKDPMMLLAERPRWIVTSDAWSQIRARPSHASETAAPEYDATLADGSAGYALCARFDPAPAPANPWKLLAALRPPRSAVQYGGPDLRIYERVR